MVIEVENITSENPVLMLFDDVLLLDTYSGTYSAATGVWSFDIPDRDKGLYWYSIYERENKTSLKIPIEIK